MIKRLCAATLCFSLFACGPVEVRIDETKGVPALKGQTEVSLSGSFTCGQTLPAGEKSVATRVVAGGCEFTFDDSLEVLGADEYQQIGELKTASNLVQRVEFTIKKLAFTDGAGAALDLSTRVTSVTLALNGQQVADKSALTRLPAVVKIDGAALAQLKAKVDARQPASVAVKAVAVLPDMPAPPDKLKIDYEAQPAVIIGPGEVKVF